MLKATIHGSRGRTLHYQADMRAHNDQHCFESRPTPATPNRAESVRPASARSIVSSGPDCGQPSLSRRCLICCAQPPSTGRRERGNARGSAAQARLRWCQSRSGTLSPDEGTCHCALGTNVVGERSPTWTLHSCRTTVVPSLPKKRGIRLQAVWWTRQSERDGGFQVPEASSGTGSSPVLVSGRTISTSQWARLITSSEVEPRSRSARVRSCSEPSTIRSAF